MEDNRSITVAGYQTTTVRIGDVRRLRSAGWSEEAISERLRMPLRVVRGALEAAADEAQGRHARLAGVELDIADRAVREAIANLDAVVRIASIEDEEAYRRAVMAFELRDRAIKTVVAASDNRRKAINRASEEVLGARELESVEPEAQDTKAPEGLPGWLAEAVYPESEGGKTEELA